MDVQEPKAPLPRITTKLRPLDGVPGAEIAAAGAEGQAQAAPRPPLDFRSQMALENAGPAAASADISDFRRQLQAEDRQTDTGAGISDFRRQIMAEEAATRVDTGISDFRRQIMEEAANEVPVQRPVQQKPDKPAPEPEPAPVAPPPAAPEPDPVVLETPQQDPPLPGAIAPETPPAKPPLETVREALGADEAALADLDRLSRSGLLDAADPGGSASLLDHLERLATTETAPGIDRKRLLADLLHDVAATAGRGLESLPPRQAAVAAGEDYLLRSRPAEYARLVAGLATGSGKEVLDGSGTVQRPAEFKTPPDGSLASALFEQSFGKKVDPAGGGTFGQRFNTVLAAVGSDPEARGRLGRLLVEGALGSADARGRTVLERLASLADPAEALDPRLAPAVPDRARLVAGVLEATDPAAGPRDGDGQDPRRLFARESPAEYARVVAEVLTRGETALRPQAHADIEIDAGQVAERLAASDPPADPTDFITSGAFMQPGKDVQFNERVARLREALAERPDAQTALDLVALKLQRDEDRPLHPERGLHLEDLDRLLELADPATPLADGIDRLDFLSSLIKGLATPGEEIDQGKWQTCTVTVLQRTMAEWQPAEYIRLMTELAKPEGTVRLARRKESNRKDWELDGGEIVRPDDWAASAGRDGRDVASRLFQTAMMHYAVKSENLAAYKQAGFPVAAAQADTYDNATDTWTDAFGDVHRGMNATMLNRLAGELRGDGFFEVGIPAVVQEILARPGFDPAGLLKTIFNGLSEAKAREAKTWNVPVALELTYPDGRKQLHEVLLTTITDGPPPLATIVDPQDGRSKQIALDQFGKSLRSISVPSDAAERLDGLTPFLPAIAAVAGTTLAAGGSDAQDLMSALAPVLLSYLGGGAAFASKPVDFGLPDQPPGIPPDAAQTATIARKLPPGDTPGRFALDVLLRSGALDQGKPEGRALLAGLRAYPPGEPERFSEVLRDLAFGPLDGPSFEQEGDAGGTRGRRFIPDAGGTRGRRFIPDAGGGSGLQSFLEDAGGTRGRRFIPDAGGGGQGQAAEFTG